METQNKIEILAPAGDTDSFLAAIAAGVEITDERIDREEARKEYEALRYCRLLARLRHRAPDERAGWSLLIYRNLTQADIDELTAP